MPRAIETDFPIEKISQIAQVESWRKEIHRPIYHIQKWWAQRLGSVFRATILASCLPHDGNVMGHFYASNDFSETTVFDPFMGSGTTIGEAAKLGCKAIGRDINPVAYHGVRTALGPIDRATLEAHFRRVRSDCEAPIRELYITQDREGNKCEALYFFWVKQVNCPGCATTVDLFPNYIFAKHAYPDKHPVQIFCPGCNNVFCGNHKDRNAKCPQCDHNFDPCVGTADGAKATCHSCKQSFKIIAAVSKDTPPSHRLYAKLVLNARGGKEYLPITQSDLLSYRNAASIASETSFPEVAIEPGHNTQQVLNYGYKHWLEMFNGRQLVALGLLAGSISSLPSSPEKDAIVSLFLSTLEFNNMFASYKGEGTGAVRHMFSHHILKPERMPLEANVWGTPKSSGSFSTLYKSRLLRALEYKNSPFELDAVVLDGKVKSRKVYGISKPLNFEIVERYPSRGLSSGQIYLSCGSSVDSGLPTGSVDVVVTDPPFFDNVHYSELADFFFVWQRLFFSSDAVTTRHREEVQDTNSTSFSLKLLSVFAECHRVLGKNGLLVFSYHHSREEGWISVGNAVLGAGFTIVQSHPVKAEMEGATPKSQAKEPIDLDVILVCRKASEDRRPFREPHKALEVALSEAESKVYRLNHAGRRLSRNDVRVIVLSQLLVQLSAGGRNPVDLMKDFSQLQVEANERILLMHSTQTEAARTSANPAVPQAEWIQLELV